MGGTVPLEILRADAPVQRLAERSYPLLDAPRHGPVYTPEEIEALERALAGLGYGD
jgi:hypothetical protein